MDIKRIILPICFVLFAEIAGGQDIHFSQIDVNPILTNPAYCGFFEGKARFGATYRNQWATVSDPYQTFAATAEYNIIRNRYHSNGFNIGAIFATDKAGSLDYGVTQGTLTLSFFQSLSKTNENFLALAVEAGFGQRSFQPGNAEMTDPSETFGNTRTTFIDAGAGIAWMNQFSDRVSMNAGLNVKHLNRPNISYLGLDETFLEPRTTAYSRFSVWLNEAFTIRPAVMLQFQQQYSEYIYGLDLKINLAGRSYQQKNLFVGCYFRLMDAIMASVILEYNGFLFSVNYDINISKLKPASRSVGAFELGLVYTVKEKSRVKKVKAIPCPIF